MEKEIEVKTTNEHIDCRNHVNHWVEVGRLEKLGEVLPDNPFYDHREFFIQYLYIQSSYVAL